MAQKTYKLLILLVILSMAMPFTVFAQKVNIPDPIKNFTILHTNDFHGQLEASGSNPGMARVATVVNGVRATKIAGNVLLVDAGDEMQGSLLSNLQKGAPVIAVYNAMGYDVATYGNHEFDWGQTILGDRVTQATYPYVSANIVVKDTANCDASTGWGNPAFVDHPYFVKTVNGVKVAFIGVTTPEVPTITIASATAGLCFKDPADSIAHYYDAMRAESDVIVVLSHLGFGDGGYGYGIPVYGDKTLAQKLITAGKPVSLIIGGHSHTDLGPLEGTPLPTPLPPDYVVVGTKTAVVQALSNGLRVGQADIAFNSDTKIVTVTWKSLIVDPAGVKDPAIDNLVTGFATDPDYVAQKDHPIGYTQVDLSRNQTLVGSKWTTLGDNMMGSFVDDAIYNSLNTDTNSTNDIDLFFNNAGGIRTSWCAKEKPAGSGTYEWSSSQSDCNSGVWAHDPMLLTYGNMFTILPFGNATIVGTMTGAQILQVLNQSATLGKGAIQPSGIRYKFYAYKDANPGPQPYAWGAYDYCVVNKTTKACDPLEMEKTYRVGTNEFLAPAGGDNYGGFKYMTNITYWGDMLDAVNAYVSATYTLANPYKGPNGDGTLDGRITREGNDATGPIIPITILHHNDSHGNLAKGTYVGFTQLATLIKQERLHNPDRTLLFNLGDSIQGDAMMYYFKNAAMGTTADGAALPPALWTNPFVAVMNALGYNGMVLGNHEFNFGASVFDSTFSQAAFPILGANVTDSGAYGINKVGLDTAATTEGIKVNVRDGIEFSLSSGDPAKPIKVGFLGLTNHRVPNYELPSNIPGLTFSNPIDTAASLIPTLRGRDDVVVALTHIGFTNNPKDVNVDNNVDTYLAAQVGGIDAIVGSHSHTDPSKQTDYSGPYKYLPTIVGGPNNAPVLVTQAFRFNNYLGEVVLGVRAKTGGGYEVVSRAGQYIAVTMDTPEDDAIKAIVNPYSGLLTAYNNTIIGKTSAPIDTLKAFTEETNGANLQADASVYELRDKNGIPVDFHLSGAMTNKLIATTATVESPYTLKISDMFAAMPYENSLLVLKMNGPQLKAVLERAYRNYYYYKYVPGYGGYSYYTTCMIDTNKNNVISYAGSPSSLPNGNNVVSLVINGTAVDFKNATKFYNVSTVNYLAAGSCNFNDDGKTLWPLNQIVADTQFYVRDAVIDYVKHEGTVSPAIENRLNFINQSLFFYFPSIFQSVK